jgi:hypothetical protein
MGDLSGKFVQLALRPGPGAGAGRCGDRETIPGHLATNMVISVGLNVVTH